MGAGTSSEDVACYDLTTNDYLLLFAGELPITNNDPFWESFLTFTLKPPTTREVDEIISKQLKSVYKTLSSNNLKTGNFATLINYVSKNATVSQLVAPSSESPDGVNLIRCRCFNALFIIRCFLKYLIEHTTDQELVKHFQHPIEEKLNIDDVPDKGFRKYIQTLVDLIINLPVVDSTYDMHIEAVNSLLVVLSKPLFSTVHILQLTAFKILMGIPEAGALMTVLIQRYVDQPKRPMKSPSGIFYGFASDILNFFTFGKQNENENCSALGNHSVLLILVLVNHSNSSSNPYRNAISSYTANVNGLYEVLYQTIHTEENTLLLYHLLHCNINFKNYLLARSDIELMLLPILKRIYFAADSSCHHMYMSLIILLILTEDKLFNKTVHSMIIKGVPWYTERSLTEVSLGGLIILVTARTIQYNLLRMRDKYLHTNCLAALANMSSQFSNLHPYVCQRLIGLFEVLSKTHSRTNVDVLAVEEAIRIILEVINSCLTHQLIHNTNFIYTLLYNKHIFQPFRNHEAFHDIIQNIDLVITYFSKKLEKEEEQSADVDEILEKVQRWSLQWPRDLMKKFPDLKFKYVEEEKPEEFFIPYVWSLVGKLSGIYWDATLYKL